MCAGSSFFYSVIICGNMICPSLYNFGMGIIMVVLCHAYVRQMQHGVFSACIFVLYYLVPTIS